MYSKITGIVLLSTALSNFEPTVVAQPLVPEAAPAPQLQLQPPQSQALDAPEVLDGGLLHEAFARPLALEAQPILIDRLPPEPIDELPPEQRPEGANINWLPGYWMFDVERDDFVWVSGLWRNFPPGRTWIPGEWQQVATGFQWMAGYWAQTQVQEQALLPLPPATLEQGPSSPAPGNNFLWTPGCWQWQGSNYAWQPGFWYAAQPDWVWVPHHYSYTPRGAVYVRGYWDYPLARRGIIYAPVYWGTRAHAGIRFTYRPSTLVNTGLLAAHLFLDHNHGRYYYGRSWGVGRPAPNWLSPWGNRSYSQWGRHHGRSKLHDPLWSHFRWNGHGKQGYGKLTHQQLANSTRTRTRNTKADDLFRKVDRLTVAERKSLNLLRNNAADLTKFRKQAEKYRNFDRTKLVRDQRGQGKGERVVTQRSSQNAGNRTQAKTRTNVRAQTDRVLSISKPAKNAERTKGPSRNQASNRTTITQRNTDSRVRADSQLRTNRNDSFAAQIREKTRAQADASAQRRRIQAQNQAQNQFQQNGKRTDRQQVLSNRQRSTTPDQTARNQAIQRYLNSRSKARGTVPAVGNLGLGQPRQRARTEQRAAKPQTAGNTTQQRTTRVRTQQGVRPSQTARTNQSQRSGQRSITSQAKTRTTPSTRQTTQSRGNQTQRSRGNGERSNYRPPTQRRVKRSK